MIGHLTEREVAVGRELVKGKDQAEIALSLGMNRATVKQHILRMAWKLGRPDFDILPHVFVAAQLMYAAQTYPLVAAALEL